jgi:hypothetical protein
MREHEEFDKIKIKRWQQLSVVYIILMSHHSNEEEVTSRYFSIVFEGQFPQRTSSFALAALSWLTSSSSSARSSRNSCISC